MSLVVVGEECWHHVITDIKDSLKDGKPPSSCTKHELISEVELLAVIDHKYHITSPSKNFTCDFYQPHPRSSVYPHTYRYVYRYMYRKVWYGQLRYQLYTNYTVI